MAGAAEPRMSSWPATDERARKASDMSLPVTTTRHLRGTSGFQGGKAQLKPERIRLGLASRANGRRQHHPRPTLPALPVKRSTEHQAPVLPHLSWIDGVRDEAENYSNCPMPGEALTRFSSLPGRDNSLVSVKKTRAEQIRAPSPLLRGSCRGDGHDVMFSKAKISRKVKSGRDINSGH